MELIRAEREAERETRQRRITVEADRALAETAAEVWRISAEAEAEARVDAEGQKLRNEAQNTLDGAHLSADLRRQMIRSTPFITQASADPVKSVDSVRVVKVDGLTGEDGAGRTPAQGTLAQDVLNATLDYRAQAPLVDRLMREVGVGAFGPEESSLPGGPDGPDGPDQTAGPDR